MNTTDWFYFKQLLVQKNMFPQYIETDQYYWLKAYEAGVLLAECSIDKLSQLEDKEDFELNYKDNSNGSITNDIVITDGQGTKANQLDTDGAQIVRQKAAKKGWSFWALPIEFTTSLLSDNLYCKDANGTDIAGITYKIYNNSNVEITVPGLLNVNLGTCVKTVIDFEPAFDYEMIGGALRINNNPATDVRMWVIGAPDIPAIYGGSKEFASGINLKFLAPDSSFEMDGRVSKYVTYSAVTHSGKLRIVLKHDAGLQLNAQIIIHMYRL
jgi:hypothetical protein